jgi:hypothetical protein
MTSRPLRFLGCAVAISLLGATSPTGINFHLKSASGNPWENEKWQQTITGPCEATFPVVFCPPDDLCSAG